MKELRKIVVKEAFTLVELLVVMVIIGILIGLAVFGLSAAQKSARDTNRKNDARNMITALETFALKNGGAYPNGASVRSSIDPTAKTFDIVDSSGAIVVSGVPLKAVGLQALSVNVADCTDSTKTNSIQTTFAFKTTVDVSGAPTGFTLCVGLETEPTKGFTESRGGDQ